MTIGKFVWYDVMTTDVKGAEAFYKSVVGWNMADAGMGAERVYTLLLAGEAMVGGIMPIPEHAKGMPPMWMGYIWAENVDAKALEVVAEGGKIWRAPEDIPNVGRFAVAADPHGAGFILFQPNMAGTPDPDNVIKPGHIGWNELHAGNGDEAFAFYSKLFGWTKSTAMPMGPMGTYQIFKTGEGRDVGAIMTKMKENPVPSWQYYFNVGDIDATVERIVAGGGKVIMGPHEVPGPMWIVNAIDPQGAYFNVVGTRAAKA